MVWCDVVVQTGLLKEAAQRFVDVLQSVVVATGLINGLLVPGGRLVGDGVRTAGEAADRRIEFRSGNNKKTNNSTESYGEQESSAAAKEGRVAHREASQILETFAAAIKCCF